ncbi:MAG: CBS domain-containing protein [Candidatus Omnitrophota bacterium]
MMTMHKIPDSVFVFFSQIHGLKVLDRMGQRVGVLHDIIVEPMGKYARSKTLIISKGGLRKIWAALDWVQVSEVTVRYIRLNLKREELKFSDGINIKTDLSLRQDILDQQVVDTNNQNVIRVNDIHFLQADQELVLAHVDIGMRGIFRRLGFERVVDRAVACFNKDASYLHKPRFIPWHYIQPLSINPVSRTIKVDVSQKELAKIPPEELSEIMLDLAPQHRVALFKTLDIITKSQLLATLDFKSQQSLLEDLAEKDAVEILNHLPADEAVDLLAELPRKKTDSILSLMESKNAKMLSTLLGYSGESAGGLMTTEYIAVLQDSTIEQALNIVKEKTPKAETIQNIYIVDSQGHLVGTTFLRRLIIANIHDNVMMAALKKTVMIRIEDDVQKIALLMDKYNIAALPVVDENKILVGIITIDDIFSRLVSIAWRKSKKQSQI